MNEMLSETQSPGITAKQKPKPKTSLGLTLKKWLSPTHPGDSENKR